MRNRFPLAVSTRKRDDVVDISENSHPVEWKLHHVILLASECLNLILIVSQTEIVSENKIVPVDKSISKANSLTKLN